MTEQDSKDADRTTVPVSLSDSAYVELEMRSMQSDEEASERASKLLAERLTKQRGARERPDYFKFALTTAGVAFWGLMCVWALNSATVPTPVSAPVSVAELLPNLVVAISAVTLVAAVADLVLSTDGDFLRRGGKP